MREGPVAPLVPACLRIVKDRNEPWAPAGEELDVLRRRAATPLLAVQLRTPKDEATVLDRLRRKAHPDLKQHILSLSTVIHQTPYNK